MEGSRPRRGALDTIVLQAKRDRKRLDSTAVGPFSLTAIGIASVVGGGIFVTTGVAASAHAGPAVVISFVFAGIVALVTALCYAELASMIPAAGSTYSYTYAAFGIFPAWFIGWDLLLEYLFAASAVAVGWSGYAVSLLDSAGIHVPSSLANPPFGSDAGVVNLPAVVIVAATTFLLVVGMRQSARANNTMVVIKMAVLLLFVVIGAFHVATQNWHPFLPANTGHFGDFGVTGLLQGAGVVFFAYVGFDAVSTAAAEARNPQRTVPFGLMATVLISTVLYVAIGLVMTGMAHYTHLGVADPLSKAIQVGGGDGMEWLTTLIDVGAVIGLASTVLVTFYGQTRIFMRMSSDGMLPPSFGRVSERFKTPEMSTILCGVVGGVVAGLTPIETLSNLVSIGTLFAFMLVCAGVMVLRRRRPDVERAFRVPHVYVVASVGILFSLLLMFTLPVDTFIRLVIWLAIGLVVFFTYARSHTRERFAALEAEAAKIDDPPPQGFVASGSL
jgi:basic amino acid/polyamine antiporter, APA family